MSQAVVGTRKKRNSGWTTSFYLSVTWHAGHWTDCTPSRRSMSCMGFEDEVLVELKSKRRGNGMSFYILLG